MQKLYYYFEGGLGDVIIQYYKSEHLTRLIEHRNATQAYVRVVLNVHNAQAYELFRHHVGIDEIQFVSFQPKLRNDIHADLEKEGFVRANKVVMRSPDAPSVALSAGDEAYLQRMLPSKRLVLLHPGSGKARFSLYGRLEFLPLLDAAAKAGVVVVMVGGPSMRLKQDSDHDSLTEPGFPDHPALVNLVGLANPRLVCEIARRCIGFLGTLSCYVWAATHHRKPGVCFIPAGFHDDYVTKAVNAGISLIELDKIGSDASSFDGLISTCLK